MSGSPAQARVALIGKFIASAILTLILFGAMEYLAGFALLPIEVTSGERSSDIDTVSATLAWLWINPAPLQEDPDYLWRNQPLADRVQFINPQAYGSEAEWRVVNNSRGFRGPEVEEHELGDRVYRILCIGDSVTFGFNGDQEDSYPAQLIRLLRSKYPRRTIEVINAGVPGWTWLQGVRFLEREGLGLEPDLVIMAHGVNDQLMRALETDAEKLERADRRLVKWIGKARMLVGETNIYRLVEQQIVFQPPPAEPSPGCQEHISSDGTCKRVALPEIEAAVARAASLTKTNGIDFMILNLDFMSTPAVEAVKAASEKAGVLLIDHVHQMDFMRASDEAARSDGLGLSRSGERFPVGANRQSIRLEVLFRLQTPDSTGSYSARGHAVYSAKPFEFNTPLNDDGRNGDEKPGDGVYSGILRVPRDMGAHSYLFYRNEDPEFESLPPLESAFADRSLRFYDGFTTPVFRFAERFMMAEQTHPNAEGYGMIAETVAFEISKRPSFHRRRAR